MKQLSLKVKTREATGRKAVRQLRSAGDLPSVVYGESGTRHLQIKLTDFLPVWKQTLSSTAFIELQEEGREPTLSLLQEVQRDACSDQFYHVDFREVTRGKPINASVALHIVGESVGVTTYGGVLEVHTHETEVRCRPSHMPEFIEVDISDLQIGDSLRLKDITLSEDVELLGDPQAPIVSCSQPRLSVEEEEATETDDKAEDDKEAKEAAADPEKEEQA